MLIAGAAKGFIDAGYAGIKWQEDVAGSSIETYLHGGCKNFCVNGPRAGNCRITRSDDDRSETRRT